MTGRWTRYPGNAASQSSSSVEVPFAMVLQVVRRTNVYRTLPIRAELRSDRSLVF
jgi:hypothetical protein